MSAQDIRETIRDIVPTSAVTRSNCLLVAEAACNITTLALVLTGVKYRRDLWRVYRRHRKTVLPIAACQIAATLLRHHREASDKPWR